MQEQSLSMPEQSLSEPEQSLSEPEQSLSKPEQSLSRAHFGLLCGPATVSLPNFAREIRFCSLAGFLPEQILDAHFDRPLQLYLTSRYAHLLQHATEQEAESSYLCLD